jgi:hypothetical protein
MRDYAKSLIVWLALSVLILLIGRWMLGSPVAINVLSLVFSIGVTAGAAWVALEQFRTGRASNFARLWPIESWLPSDRRTPPAVLREAAPIRFWFSEAIWIALGLLFATLAVDSAARIL